MIVLIVVMIVLGLWGVKRVCQYVSELLHQPVRPPFQTIRGSEYVPTCEAARHLASGELSLAGYALPHRVAATGILVTGVAATGKSRTIVEYIRSVLQTITPGSGSRLVLFDPKNEFLPLIAMLTHEQIPIYLLNPFEARGTRWRISADVAEPATAVTLATALQPDQPHDANAFFSKAGRAVLREVVQVFQQFAPATWTLRQLTTVVRDLQLAQAVLKLLGTTASSAEQYLAGKSGRDVAATAAASTDVFLNAAAAWDRADGDISLQEILATECVVILGWDDAIGPALSGAYGLFMELLVNYALTNQDASRLTHVVIDELRMLPKSCGHALNRAAFRGRSSAICPLIAFQDWNSLLELYGHAGANELAANFQTKLFLRQGSDEAAEWAAKCLGKPEASWKTKGFSDGSTRSYHNSQTTTHSTTEHIGDRHLVHPSELRSLPLADPEQDRITGYLLTPSLSGPTKFVAPFLRIARACAPHTDFPAYIRRPATDQIAKPFSAADADALNFPSTEELLAALAKR